MLAEAGECGLLAVSLARFHSVFYLFSHGNHAKNKICETSSAFQPLVHCNIMDTAIGQ